jgi:hypothetical protein
MTYYRSLGQTTGDASTSTVAKAGDKGAVRAPATSPSVMTVLARQQTSEPSQYDTSALFAQLSQQPGADDQITRVALIGGAVIGGVVLVSALSRRRRATPVAPNRGRGRKRMRKNPLSRNQKLIAVGGLVVVGGLAAFALTRGRASAQDGGDASAAADAARAAKAAECAALQDQLVALRSQPSPPVAEVRTIEQQIAACIAQAREMGAPIDAASEALSAGDALNAQIDASFGEYRATEYSDALKRNNIRKENLDRGAQMAAQYSESATQSTNDAAAQLSRASIVRALDSALQRRDCYLYDQRGCGRFGVNEDHGNDKAASEQTRIVGPLMGAYNVAVAKLGGASSERVAPGAEAYVSMLLRSAQASKDYTDAKFAEYKSVDYSDALRRNNLRQEVLYHGATTVVRLQDAYSAALAHRNIASMRSVARVAAAALDAAMSRRACYLFDQPGCGRFAVNEDHGNDKAKHEQDRVITPLTNLYRQIANALVSMGDKDAFLPLVDTKLKFCASLKSYVDSKFAEYKSVDYSDAVRRNNLRQVVLSNGAALAACLTDALDTALNSGGGSLIAAALSKVPLLSMFNFRLTGTSGLGATSVPMLQLDTSRLVAPLVQQQTKLALSPQITQQIIQQIPLQMSAPPAGLQMTPEIRMLRSVGQVALGAIEAASLRRICYLLDQPGCGRFGVNEDHGNDKAKHEQDRVVGPLIAVYERIAQQLVDRGDTGAFAPLATVKLKSCAALRTWTDAKFGEYKATEYSDALKRNNLRQAVLAGGEWTAACLADALGTALRGGPDAARVTREVIAVLQPALTSAVTRRLCYLSDQPGCGRFGVNEDHGNDKGAQEQSRVINPLIATYEQAARFLVSKGDANAEVPLTKEKLRYCVSLRDFGNTKFNEYKSVSYPDALRRNNLRQEVLRAGRDLVACLQSVRTDTAAARREVRSLIESALAASRARWTCYKSDQPGCGRFALNEDHGNDKADQEASQITQPLERLLASTPLGQTETSAGMSPIGILGLAAGGLALASLFQSPAPVPNRRRRTRRRRTSRVR